MSISNSGVLDVSNNGIPIDDESNEPLITSIQYLDPHKISCCEDNTLYLHGVKFDDVPLELAPQSVVEAHTDFWTAADHMVSMDDYDDADWDDYRDNIWMSNAWESNEEDSEYEPDDGNWDDYWANILIARAWAPNGACMQSSRPFNVGGKDDRNGDKKEREGKPTAVSCKRKVNAADNFEEDSNKENMLSTSLSIKSPPNAMSQRKRHGLDLTASEN